VGIGDGEHFIASDITAIIPYTKRVLVLGEGEMVAITPLGPEVTTLDGQPIEPKLIHVDWDVAEAEKGGHPFFMVKEIHETPEAVANVLRGRLNDDGRVGFLEFAISDQHLRQYKEVRLLGMGSALYVAMAAEYVIEDWTGLPAQAADSSEFRYRRPTVGPETLTAVITQSGETADTLFALRQAKERGSLTVAITNVVASTAARDADGAIYLHAGPEIGVAATKTFVSHLVSTYLLAMRLAIANGRMSLERRQELTAQLRALPDGIRRVLASEERIAELAQRYSRFQNFLYVGRGINYPIALEGALKLKEISYRHAEGTSAGGLKHGPIALLDAEFPVIAICTESSTREKLASNVHEMVARDAPVLALVTEGDRSLEGVASDLLEIPAADEQVTAALNSVALHLFAYHLAVHLGRDVDQPRNLAKSVTVE
jgi:glucosamine--fructose-6-phosphate aminotransferase (isomerizing)